MLKATFVLSAGEAKFACDPYPPEGSKPKNKVQCKSHWIISIISNIMLKKNIG